MSLRLLVFFFLLFVFVSTTAEVDYDDDSSAPAVYQLMDKPKDWKIYDKCLEHYCDVQLFCMTCAHFRTGSRRHRLEHCIKEENLHYCGRRSRF